MTGRLHVGHALGRTLEDTLIRRARMQGFEALWVPGMDHAGIATQVVVERKLREEGIERRDLGREAFVERVWAWKEQYGGEIVEQIKRMGASLRLDAASGSRWTRASRAPCAWRSCGCTRPGLIYRGERLVNWCPTDHTGLSDSEVEHDEVDGELVTFRYPLSDGSGSIEVATTRVETMLGDTGIAVHPGDERYAALVGTTVTHPFDGREIPIVADHHVDREFGTGAVKVTPAHDPNDFDIAQRTGLPLMNILNADATLNDAVPDEFRGLDRYAARTAVRDAIEAKGLLVAEERPYLPRGGALLPVPLRDRALDRRPPVVREGRASLTGPAKEAALEGRVRVRARALAALVHRVARRPPRLEHLAPALVGAPDPGLVLPRRSRHGRGRGPDACAPSAAAARSARTTTCSTRGSPRSCGRTRRSAGPTRPTTSARSTRTPCS